MIIQNGFVFGESGQFEKRDIYCKNGRIVAEMGDAGAEKEAGNVIDAKGLYVLPGFVDIHTHGAAGHDFCDADVKGLTEMARYQKQHGITSFCPTSMAFDEERLKRIFDTAGKASLEADCARIVGINMEGPFISRQKMGAQNPAYIQKPDAAMFCRLNQSAEVPIRLITIAPEEDGAMEFIEKLKDEVCISIGHSAAGYEEAAEAFRRGARHVTHLCNAMHPFLHRNPGIIGAAADDADVMVEIICDGIHVHPSMIRSIYRIFGKEHMILISDSMEAAGMPDGTYELGGQKVIKKGEHATLSNGTLAGSAASLYDCFLNAVKFGIPLADAVQMATGNPAKSIGMEKLIGTLNIGAYADLVLMNKEFKIERVILRGM